MDVTRVATLVAVDLAIVAAFSVGPGAIAPRWPSHWLTHDVGPLRLRVDAPWSRRLSAWARRLPEAGAFFGGPSKSRLPGISPAHLRAYVIEVRRAEWVHWLSMLSVLALVPLNPWWLWLAFSLVVVAVNGTYLVLLGENRARLSALIARRP